MIFPDADRITVEFLPKFRGIEMSSEIFGSAFARERIKHYPYLPEGLRAKGCASGGMQTNGAL